MSKERVMYVVRKGEMIVRHGTTCPETLPRRAKSPGEIAEIVSTYITADTHYWDGEKYAQVQPLPYSIDKQEFVADGVDTVRITGIPTKVWVRWPDQLEEEIMDGELEVSSLQPGAIELYLFSDRYVNEVIKIEATT